MGKENILENYIIPNNKLISWREIDGEVLFLQKEEKEFFELNKTASLIWLMVIKKNKVERIIETVQKKYEKANKETIRKDVLNFISLLVEKGYFLLRK